MKHMLAYFPQFLAPLALFGAIGGCGGAEWGISNTGPKLDLSISTSVDKDSAVEGSLVNFTITVTNLGPVAATSVTAGDTLPTGLTYSSHTTSTGTAYSPTTGIWTIGALAVDSSRTLSLTATVNGGTAGTVLTNRAAVLAFQTDSLVQNNLASASVRCLALPGSSQLVVTQPGNYSAGVSFGAVVTARDGQGNTLTSFTGDVAVAIASGTGRAGAHLSGTTTVAAVAGVATFNNLSIDSAGTGYVLTASATGLASGSSTPFNIVAGTASQLAFMTQPANSSAGATLPVVVAARDAQGNALTTFAGTVTVAITSGTGKAGAHLSGTTSVAGVAGVATFSNLSIDSVGTGYTLTASAPGVLSATSGAFNVSAGAATQLAFRTQPTTVGVGASFGVAVAARDAPGNTATGYAGSVSVGINIGTGKPGANLSGTTTVAAVAGVATFTGLSIDSVGTGYRLAADATGLTTATSATFDVSAAGASDEPLDPGSGYLWTDNFDRYASVAAMQAPGGCPAGTDGFGLPDAQVTYGQRTEANNSNGCVVPQGFAFTSGLTGNALRASIHADPTHQQQSYSWLTPWPPGLRVYTGKTIVVQVMFRVSPGGTPGTPGCKWMMLWDNSGNRGEFSPYNGTTARPLFAWSYSSPGGVNRTQQPIGPWWDNINDGAWHRGTFLFTVNTSSTYHYVSGNSSANEVYTGSSSRDGRVAQWIDGNKILDYSQATVGVTPPSGLHQWAYQGDVDAIPTLRTFYLIFPSVFNGADAAFAVDHDNLKVWAF